jgi:hypothetical protein
MMAVMAKAVSAPFEPHTAPILRNAQTGRFITGNIGGGRKPGSRNKLSEQFVSDLLECWENHGKQALERCATEEPARFVQICASILPKDIDIKADISVARAMTAVEAYRVLRDMNDEERKKLRDAHTGD